MRRADPTRRAAHASRRGESRLWRRACSIVAEQSALEPLSCDAARCDGAIVPLKLRDARTSRSRVVGRRARVCAAAAGGVVADLLA
eukprot:2452750-Prymnesium_polylepis.1